MIQKQAVDVSSKRKCRYCNEEKDTSAFAMRNIAKGTRHHVCKTCFNETYRGRYKGTEAQHREKNLKKKYGISESIYQMMFIAQNGKCKICETHQSQLKHKLQIDHCHSSGKVRALLCFNCNRGLGSFKDNIENMLAAVRFLKEHK